MKKAVIYARFSSHKQQETSIEGQIKVCEDYARREGIEIIDTYIDRAISGTTDKRPGFNKMILDSSSGEFNYIIVYKLDRFARNRLDSAIYKQMLSKNGVKLKSAMEPISEAPEGILLEGMLESYNEYYSKELSQKTKRGMQINAEKAQSNGGTIPYGFTVQNKKLVIDEDAAKIVRHIFDAYAEGKTKSEIIDYYKDKHTPHGKKITMGVLTTMLSNKKYIGIYHFNGTEIEGGCPAIIDNNTFDRVQKIIGMSKVRFGTRKSSVDYILSCKTICGECGSTMQGECIRKHNGKSIHYYVCKNKRSKSSCSKRRERQEALEDEVIRITLDYVLKPENIEDIVSQIMIAVNCSTDEDQIKQINKDIEKLESTIQKNLDIICETENKEIRKKLIMKAESLESEKADLEKTLLQLKRIEKSNITPDRLKKWIQSYSELNPSNPEHRKNIVDTFIHSIIVYNDKIVVYYNCMNGKLFENKKTDRKNSTSFRFGSPSWTRTNDPAVNSRMLYRLSY